MTTFEQAVHPAARDGEPTRRRRGKSGVSRDDQSWRQVAEGASVRTRDEPTGYTDVAPLTGNDAFAARVRAALGVDDPVAPVVAERESGEDNPWGCETWESFGSITVRCAGREEFFDTLPDLIRRLDFAFEPPVTKDACLALLQQQVVVEMPHGPVTGRVGNASDFTLLLIAPKGSKHGRDGRWQTYQGEEWCWLDLQRVWKLTPVRDDG